MHTHTDCTPLTPAPGRQRQADLCGLKSSETLLRREGGKKGERERKEKEGKKNRLSVLTLTHAYKRTYIQGALWALKAANIVFLFIA